MVEILCLKPENSHFIRTQMPSSVLTLLGYTCEFWDTTINQNQTLWGGALNILNSQNDSDATLSADP